MKKFRIGNVVKTAYGSIVIITKVNDDITSWVSFSYSNSSGATKNKTHMRATTCFCCEKNDGEYDSECEDCKGTGEYEKEIMGMDAAEYLADNVKEYILDSLTKNFNF